MQKSPSMLEALDSPEKLQRIFAGFRAGSGGQAHVGDSRHGGSETEAGNGVEHLRNGSSSSDVAGLERDLTLSAQLGLALLEKGQHLELVNGDLLAKQKELETSVSQLLDRLASSYKENAQLERKAERAQANLDASEASNRQLLITLEEDRKTIRRLTAAQNKTQFNPLGLAKHSHELEDMRQELEQERRKASAAEARAKRATSKLSENEARLSTISRQLDKVNNERGRKSISASRNRSRPNSISITRSELSQESQSIELLQVIDKLIKENESVRADMQQMQDLLDSSRDQITSLRSEQHERAVFTPYDEDRDNHTASDSLLSEVLMSPDMETEVSHVSTVSTSVAGNASDWLPTAPASINAMRALPHASNASSEGASEGRIGLGRRRSHGRPPSNSAVRRMGGRAMSVDLSNLMQRKLEDLEFDYQHRPASPILGGSRPASPNLRPFALGISTNSLSSSLGSPALPVPQEDVRESDEPTESTTLELEPTPVKAAYLGEGGLSKTSPAKLRPLPTIPSQSLLLTTKDVAVQTEQATTATSKDPSTTAAAQPYGTRPLLKQYQSSILSSDATSEHENADYNTASFAGELRGNRTAALATLIEHVVRLLTRLKAADIHSLEQRLKKQNLPGDVGHLAKSTMRDILGEVDSLRNHFRQVLEQESSALSAEMNLPISETSPESLIARKDFVTLVKLFRDILFEVGRLRILINRVQLEPQLASKIGDLDTLQSPVELLTAPAADNSNSGGAAALLAPLSRLFYRAEPQPAPAAKPKLRPELGRVKSSARFVPKLSASSALASATVNVEFGGQGGVRRQVSIMPQDGSGGLSTAYQKQGSIGRNGQKATRKGLSSIFAGGAGLQSPTADPWVVLPGHASRQQKSGAPASRMSVYQPMSRGVEAIIDNVPEREDEFAPNLLERTLRPRGLSDSSIHSTFMSHANPANRLLTPAGLALSSSTTKDPAGNGLDRQATIKATMAGASPRPSVLGNAKNSRQDENAPYRQISARLGSYTASSVKSGSEGGRAESPILSSIGEAEPPSVPSPSKSPRRPSAMPVPMVGSHPSDTSLSRSPAAEGGNTGLLANIGAWASSYSDVRSNQWAPSRTVSASSSRKAATRDSDL